MTDENARWFEGRLIDPTVTTALCVHMVGTTPGLWCGACNTHPQHPDRWMLDCTGAADCPSPKHVHGCYADRDGSACDDPGDHVSSPPASTPEEVQR